MKLVYHLRALSYPISKCTWPQGIREVMRHACPDITYLPSRLLVATSIALPLRILIANDLAKFISSFFYYEVYEFGIFLDPWW